ncbi:MAG: hypothetical protein H0V62_15345 [Gammaproteobacteria bacterium]|nr:hypothetical protein [Gammaproteobacteria bacterium]
MVEILDRRGKPLERGLLREPQTAKLMHVIEQADLEPAENNLTQLYEAITRLAAGEGLLETNGWYKFPGGLILQWLRPSPNFTGGATPTVNWPIPFPATCLFAIAGDFGATNNYVTVFEVTAATLKLRSSQTAAGDAVSVFGIGV